MVYNGRHGLLVYTAEWVALLLSVEGRSVFGGESGTGLEVEEIREMLLDEENENPKKKNLRTIFQLTEEWVAIVSCSSL